jgi:hypothetical protein
VCPISSDIFLYDEHNKWKNNLILQREEEKDDVEVKEERVGFGWFVGKLMMML